MATEKKCTCKLHFDGACVIDDPRCPRNVDHYDEEYEEIEGLDLEDQLDILLNNGGL